MDAETLVDSLIDDGRKFIEKLLQSGYEFGAACWLKLSTSSRWYLYIVSPVVDTEGLYQAYLRLHPVMLATPQHFLINPGRVKLIEPNDPIARDLLAYHRPAPGAQVSGMHWNRMYLGNTSIDGAYLYLLPACAPN